VKGNQDGIVQQQIQTVGLRQWLSLVAAWIVETIYTEVAGLRYFVAPAPRAVRLKTVTVKIAVPTPIYLL
jgi:hypothetical protein